LHKQPVRTEPAGEQTAQKIPLAPQTFNRRSASRIGKIDDIVKRSAGEARESRGMRRTGTYVAVTRDEAQRSIRTFFTMPSNMAVSLLASLSRRENFLRKSIRGFDESRLSAFTGSVNKSWQGLDPGVRAITRKAQNAWQLMQYRQSAKKDQRLIKGKHSILYS